MKSMKKLFAGMFAMALALSLCLAPSAFATRGTYVFDDYGVLSSSQFSELESHAAKLANDYNQGVYLYITDTMGHGGNPTDSQRNEFARDFYLQNNLGVGANKQGIIFVIAVNSRDYVTVKKQADADPFSDECVDAIESDVVDDLKDNNWYDGSKSYYDTVDEQLAYYAATGKQWKKPNLLSLVLKILAMLGIPAVVAGAVVGNEKRAMKTAHERSEASDYLDRSSLNMTVATDEFVNTSLAVTPRPKESKGGGGWSNMGGGFSGSGGGKF